MHALFARLAAPALLVTSASALATGALAQWSPASGQWGKVDPADLRVMTYNVQDGLCSSNPKLEGQNNWCGLARIVAAFKPDVLLLQECADNTGNGTGSGVDTVAELVTTLDRFLHGGTDPFLGGAITSWVQKYAPSYDLPYVFVSSETDGYNRNVILSRYPFADLNGDTRATISDIPTVTASQWAPGGDGGIRGFMFAEIDLPNITYSGNIVVGNGHLKSGGAGTDHTQRVEAAQNVSYAIQYWYNGNGGATPDPLNKIADAPAATQVLGPQTPVVLGGDWNEDETANGATRGPASWLMSAQTVGGASDGTDRDQTDATLDSSVNFFSGSDASHSGGDKLDILSWQDSIVTLRLSTIFISGSTPGAGQPPECVGFTGGASSVTSTAADHRPVFADLRFPIADCDGNGVADTTDIANGTHQDLDGNLVPDLCECTFTNYCLSSPNPIGPGAFIGHSGTGSIAANNLVLTVTGATPNNFGIFYYGANPAQVAFGNGWRCIGNPTTRLPVIPTDPFGDTSFALNLNLPQQAVIDAGETWRFQFWYRSAGLYNLSNGLAVRFCP